jgi:hypothetical protein
MDNKTFQYQCLICAYFTNFKRDYNRHITTTKHAKNTLNHKKTLQKKNRAKNGQNLLISVKNAEIEQPFCSFLSKTPKMSNPSAHFCQKTPKMSNSNDSFLHKNAENEQKTPKEYFCEHCERGYTRKSNLIRHQNSNSCKPKETNALQRKKKDILVEQINELSKKLAVQDRIIESQEEHFRGILKEKERCIEILREQNQHITTSHFQIIQNNIIDMNAIKFLNSYCNNNPTLEDIRTKIKEGQISKKNADLITSAIQTGNFKIIGETINSIMKTTNQELIIERGVLSGICDNVIFCNDGSGRKYIAKGEPGWTYFSNDEPLDATIVEIINKTDKQKREENKNDKMIYLTGKDRTSVAKIVKKKNDWNHSKDIVIKNIIGTEPLKQIGTNCSVVSTIETLED